jgi:hypothetical protein
MFLFGSTHANLSKVGNSSSAALILSSHYTLYSFLSQLHSQAPKQA